MSRSALPVRIAGALALASFPLAAAAHPGGPVHGFLSGLAHPLSGLDHVLAMTMLGLWSVGQGRRRGWRAPAAFAVAMVIGATVGHARVAVPGVEAMIALSVVALGLLVCLHRDGASPLVLIPIALFGLCHGYAHAAGVGGASLASYAAGFLLGTALLVGAGAALGLVAARRSGARIPRALGAGAAATGAWLLISIVAV